MLQTAFGSLTVGVSGQASDVLLIWGGTSSIGLALAVLAKRRGMTVLATTRRESARQQLIDLGADQVIIDDGSIADRVRACRPGGADAAVELVGVNTLADLPGPVLQELLDAVAAGRARIPLGTVYRWQDVAQAHRAWKRGRSVAKASC